MTSIAVTLLVLCTNQNMHHSPRCMAPVAEFHRTIDGWEGTLESGVEFTQTIHTPYIHEFKAEKMHWYIIGGEVVYAN